jgi:hypothetical protein
MLEIVMVVILVAWIFGFIGHVGGDLIHLLLVLLIVVGIYRLLKSRNSGL